MNKGILSILSIGVGVAAGAGITESVKNKEIAKVQAYSDKHLALFQMMNQWVHVKQEGKSLASYFEANGYKKIAVYGMSYAGETLLQELKDTKIQVLYGIDQNAKEVYVDIDILTDAVVVTAITYFDEIEEKLLGKVECPVISLEDILYEV